MGHISVIIQNFSDRTGQVTLCDLKVDSVLVALLSVSPGPPGILQL